MEEEKHNPAVIALLCGTCRDAIHITNMFAAA